MVRSYDDTIVRANNMSAEQIIDNFNLTEEGIRHYFSSLCFGNNATEERPYKLDIDIHGTFGLSESEKILLDNYNFGMDDEIDEKMIGEIAEYAGQLRVERTAFSENLVKKLKSYCYRLLHGPNAVGSDYPWNYLVILGYFLVFFAAFPIKTDGAGRMRNVLGITWKLVFLFTVRSALWMYILWGERAPERITHSLYLMEFCILAAMLMTE